MSARYKVPRERYRAELLIDRSRFICTVERVPSVEEAQAFIRAMHTEFADATHNCWAYVAGAPGSTDRIGMSDFRRRDDRRDVEIAVLGGRRADADRMVGQPHVHGIGIGGGMHRHRLDPHFVRGAMDAQGDLAAIGDQDAFDCHGMRRLRR